MKQTAWNLPAIAYGAVYFRKSGPPREDWERDYAQAARDGMNTFRHWFLWSAIEVAPWAGREPHLRCAAPNCNSLLQARLHSGAGGLYLWLINASNSDLEAAFALSKRHGAIEQMRLLWGKSDVHVEGQTLRTHVPRMDALVLQLRPAKS